MFGSPETTPGGRALKFYASVRIDIRRIAQIKKGQDVVGSRTKIKIVKNKLAPPFREVELDILYGEGLSYEGDLIDLGAAMEIVEKSGMWYSFEGERIGQGRDATRQFLKEHPEIAERIDAKVREKAGLKPKAGRPAEPAPEEKGAQAQVSQPDARPPRPPAPAAGARRARPAAPAARRRARRARGARGARRRPPRPGRGAAPAGAPPAGGAPRVQINELLRLAVERKASDLHLKVGASPVLRLDGRLTPLQERERLSREWMTETLFGHHDPGAEGALQEEQRPRHGLQRPRPRALPREHLPAARDDGRGAARDPDEDPDDPRAGPAAGAREARARAARADPRDRDHRQRQVDLARGDDRPHQRPAATATS